MYSNFWVRVAIAFSGMGAAAALCLAGDPKTAGLFFTLFLIASGIDRQAHLDRRRREPARGDAP
jgi:hypothetical protein